MVENQFPLLEGRDVDRYQVKWDNKWVKYGFHLAEPRNLELFQDERLLARRTMGEKIIAAWCNEDMISNALLHVVKIPSNYSGKSVLSIVISKLLAYYFRKMSGRDDKAFPEIKVHQLRSLPIMFDCNHDFKVDSIMTSVKDFEESVSNLLNLLQTQFDIPKPSTKLQQWPSLDFKGFMAELGKAKVVLSLEKQEEWMAYFTKKKTEANALQSEIDRIDKEIDKMVYGLYGLTQEEIAIVENA